MLRERERWGQTDKQGSKRAERCEVKHKTNSNTTWICKDKGGEMDSTGYRLGEDIYVQTKIKEGRVRVIYLVIRNGEQRIKRLGGAGVIERWGLWEMVAFFIALSFSFFPSSV